MSREPEAPVVDPAIVDLARLQQWMTAAGLGTGPLSEVTVLSGGTQNVLLKFRRDRREYILRRPPEHKRPNSDDTMRREARVLAALAGTGVPHPRFIAGCDDLGIIGAAFYLMEPVDGFNPAVEIPETIASRPERQRELGLALVDGLLALSRVIPSAAGLDGFGRPDGWLQRQVPRWQRQLASYARLDGYRGDELTRVDEVAQWLVRHRPPHEEWQPGIIHGDFHLANVMMRRRMPPKLAAIVDWELASQGDPLLDLGQLLATWPRSDHPIGVDPAVPLPGLPTDRELLEYYGRHSDRDLADVTWFRVLACYRLAILIEGSFARALAGKAAMDMGSLSHQRAVALIDQATELMASS